MKLILILLFSFIFNFSCSSSTTFITKKNSLLTLMTQTKSVNQKNMSHVFNLFSQADKLLVKKMDPQIISELARLLGLASKIEKNYYLVEPFSKIIKKDKKNFLKSLKKVLSKKLYEDIADRIFIFSRELRQGNG